MGDHTKPMEKKKKDSLQMKQRELKPIIKKKIILIQLGKVEF